MKKPARKTANTATRSKPTIARRATSARGPKRGSAPTSAKRSLPEPSVAELKRVLAQRDRRIEALEKQGGKDTVRVEKLEARVKTLKGEAKEAKAEIAGWESCDEQWREAYAELEAKRDTDVGIWKEKYDKAFKMKLAGESAVTELAQYKARGEAAVDGRVAKLVESTSRYKKLWEQEKKAREALSAELQALRGPSGGKRD